MNQKYWCVKSREGWCAARPNRRFSDTTTSVATRCAHYVTFPYGCEFREPTCPECLAVLRLEESIR